MMRWLWNPAHYWPLWFGVLVLGVFGFREFWALGTGRPQDTFSWWVWRTLKITSGEGIASWSALNYWVFAAYCAMFIWLAYHFFWHKFA